MRKRLRLLPKLSTLVTDNRNTQSLTTFKQSKSSDFILGVKHENVTITFFIQLQTIMRLFPGNDINFDYSLRSSASPKYAHQCQHQLSDSLSSINCFLNSLYGPVSRGFMIMLCTSWGYMKRFQASINLCLQPAYKNRQLNGSAKKVFHFINCFQNKILKHTRCCR